MKIILNVLVASAVLAFGSMTALPSASSSINSLKPHYRATHILTLQAGSCTNAWL